MASLAEFMTESNSTLENGTNHSEILTTTTTNYSNMSTMNAEESIIEFDTGHMAWVLTCVSITWLMIPGVGFLYSGMTTSKSSLVILMWCFWTVAVVSIQWYVIGYSLCLSNTGSPFIGNIDNAFFWGLDHTTPSAGNPKIPALLVGIWYCLFAAITPTIIIGAIVERARLLSGIVFTFLWSTFVFDVLTYWTWNGNGWTNQLGALDFGGGTPVHIATGATALAYAILLGKRSEVVERPPHNMVHVILGTSFVWLGWLVANAGSDIAPNYRTVIIFITTNMSASIGGLTWVFLDYFWLARQEKKLSGLGFCIGMICGLVAITPASGFVSPASSLAFGFLGATSCKLALVAKKWFPIVIDDSFDVFAAHGIGGIVGNLLTGVFAQKSIAAVDGIEIQGGGLDGNWKQVGIQAIDTVASGSWAFVVSLIILYVIDKIPGLGLRVTIEEEEIGLDLATLGESANQDVEELKARVAKLEKIIVLIHNTDNLNIPKPEIKTNGVVLQNKHDDDELPNGLSIEMVQRL